MKTEEEAIHFLKSAELRTGKNVLLDMLKLVNSKNGKYLPMSKIIKVIRNAENIKDSCMQTKNKFFKYNVFL